MEGKDQNQDQDKQVASTSDAAKQEQLNKILEALRLATGEKQPEQRPKTEHTFWKTQPVPDFNEEFEEDGPYEADKKPEEIRQTPYPLPAGYEWSEVDIEVEEQLKELYTLLTLNYVEDEDAMFRFDYSPEFLKWALQPPEWRKSWLAGIRVSSNQKLVAFISAIPANLNVYARTQFMVEVNFLCIHKKLRSKRLAPVLIKEITRRVNVTGHFQAAYTAGIKIPRPISSCRYFHRSLNPKKLVETGFSHLGKNMTMARLIKLYKLPEAPQTPGFRELTDADVPAVYPILTTFLRQFKLAPAFSEEEFRHYFLPRDQVIYSYVVEDPLTNTVTDFVSFYSLPSTVINHPVHKTLNVAYCYYYANTRTNLTALINDLLIVAKEKGFDVFNCLNLLNNGTFLEDLKFGKGDGELQFYLYNWKCKTMPPEGVGLVLL